MCAQTLIIVINAIVARALEFVDLYILVDIYDRLDDWSLLNHRV